MGRRGRPQKPGRRTNSDRPIPMPVTFDRGIEHVQAKVARFGQDHATALGRAYASGLLGDGELAKVRYDVGKKFARLYGIYFPSGYRCPLDQSPRGHDTHDGNGEEYAWLMRKLGKLTEPADRKYLDQLIADQHVDGGPWWLDRLIEGGGHSVWQAKLDCAIAALDAIAPKQRRMGILVSADIDNSTEYGIVP